MARPRTAIGTNGTISVKEVEPGKWRARTRFRTKDGKSRQIERFATGKARAANALKAALLDIEEQYGGAFSPAMKLAVLADRFLAVKAEAGRTVGTLQTYGFAVETHVKPMIGGLSIREATPEVLQEYLNRVRKERGAGAAKNSRAVLSGMLSLAVRNGALDRNPVRELEGIAKKGRPGSPSIDPAKLAGLLERVAQDEALVRSDAADVVRFIALTGWRVSEACGLRWSEIDFAAKTVTMSAIAVRHKGVGVVLQHYGKTESAARTVQVPDELLEMLERRRAMTYSAAGMVFPAARGGVRDPSNTEGDWRDRRHALGVPETTMHSFRKGVGTMLDQAGLSAREIADYLGHRNPSMTQDVYMARNLGSGRAAEAIASRLGS